MVNFNSGERLKAKTPGAKNNCLVNPVSIPLYVDGIDSDRGFGSDGEYVRDLRNPDRRISTNGKKVFKITGRRPVFGSSVPASPGL